MKENPQSHVTTTNSEDKEQIRDTNKLIHYTLHVF